MLKKSRKLGLRYFCLIIAMLSLSLGCNEKDELPERIQIFIESEGESFNDCAGEECAPRVVGMCEFTDEGSSMLLVRLKEYEEAEDLGCEDRRFRYNHAIASFDVIHIVAGEKVDTPLKVIDFGYLYPDALGETFLIYPRKLDDELILVDAHRVNIADSTAVESGDDNGAAQIIDVPVDYEEFVRVAQDHWENFAERCPGQVRHEPAFPENHDLFERPAYCNDEDPGTVNQDDPDSINEDDDL